MRRRLLRLVVLSIVSSVVASAVGTVVRKARATSDTRGADTSAGLDQWPEVPRRPAG